MGALEARGSVDCGHSGEDVADQRVLDCVRDSLNGHQPFTATMDEGLWPDSHTVVGWVFAGEVMHELHYDSDTCGQGSRDTGCQRSCGPHITQTVCHDPRGDSSTLISCRSQSERERLCPEGDEG